MAEIMDGKGIAVKVLERCAQRVATIEHKTGTKPTLATVLVGDDPGSATYVRMKQRRCDSVGMQSQHHHLKSDSATDELVTLITALGEDTSVHGILLQHPVPSQIDERRAFEAIDPAKDVDGVTIHSFGTTAFDLSGFGCCTPAGMMRLLEAYEVDLVGKRAVVIGRSPIVGKPMAMMLLAAHATVTICHSRTRELGDRVHEADVVVAALGRPRFIRGDWIKRGAVVLDAGYNEGNVGDVEYEAAAERAALITPVPGGVGPMTIAMLMDQTATAASRQLGLNGF